MLRTASIFQGIAALIAVVGLVGWVIDLFYTVSSINHLYDDVYVQFLRVSSRPLFLTRLLPIP